MDRICLVISVVLILDLLWSWWRQRKRRPAKKIKRPQPTGPRRLRPRTPKDCADCQAEVGQEVTTPRAVRPWSQVKSPRGRKKQKDTEGFACPNKDCEYHGITDDQIHALVGDGHHGKKEPIQDLTCQACGTRFTVRRDTPLYRLKTSAQRVAEVLAALAEGLDMSAAVRVFGHTQATIHRWLTRAGMHSERLHRHLLHDLVLGHVQLDELKTRLRQKSHEVWLWVALDVKTKLVAAIELGPRTQARAHRLIHQLRQVLAPGCLPVFTSDGLNQYFYALTAHFGQWVRIEGKRKPQWMVSAELLYGQVKKFYRRRRIVRIEHRMQWGELADLKACLKSLGLTGRLNTAFVERVNLTIRQAVAPLIRRTWGTAQTSIGLSTHVHWWRAYYHFARPHLALRVELAQSVQRSGKQTPRRYRSRTPAVAAGITHHRWSVVELLSYPLSEGSFSTSSG